MANEGYKNMICVLLMIAIFVSFMLTMLSSTNGSSSSSKNSAEKQGTYSNGQNDSFVAFVEEYGWLLIIATACLCYCAIVPCVVAVCPCFSERVNPLNGRIVEADVEISNGM